MLFSHYCGFKEISFYYFLDNKFCEFHVKKNKAKQNKKHVNSIYCLDHVCKTNEWCLVDCCHGEIRVSTQKWYVVIASQNANSSACDGLLMVLQAIFLRFKIFTLIRFLSYRTMLNCKQHKIYSPVIIQKNGWWDIKMANNYQSPGHYLQPCRSSPPDVFTNFRGRIRIRSWV